ncbi:prepilin-type N-terminal cleavage/methylation domain-containing protein [Clostridium magnum]|uniref:Uncharacterized protein n=1 Tax=Clostridium magnum DSM 2767 TaxID=1121326 RepID=A0A161X1P9_9CLOT|nr:prepilin-type N-terminal cleavage/methylation domain-containing protein [Clostridium magnum]KZL93388.1 hypothetical protein CLMAG_04120 [Clostridium magnum DSM 2767]SHI15986.1 prepilin-type N-terminal cleavage/methylation domain-containing protein [Clostridium magnum DSM 2767]
MRRKNGFTLIEIMIVISIIGLLSMIIVPKAAAIKQQLKDTSVGTNVLLTRSYLENRSGKDGISYQVSIDSNQTSSQALATILSNIAADMASSFSGSNNLINPFNSSATIYSKGNIANITASSISSVLIYYNIDNLPSDNNTVNNSGNLPKGIGLKGNVVIIIYSTGYVLYGVDSSGQMSNMYIIKFPPTPPSAQSGVIPGGSDNGGNQGGNDTNLTKNIGDVVSYIKSISIENIIKGVPNGQMWNIIQGPLYDSLMNKFTPGNSAKHIVNPYFLNIDTIGNENSWVNPNLNYSIISVPQPTSDIDTKYSNRPGTVIVYVKTSNPVGYIVYGVEQKGNNVGYTTINLSTEVTSQMTQTLANNVSAVYNALVSHVNANVAASPYNNQDTMSSLALQQLQGLTINNAYITSWNSKKIVSSTTFSSGYGVVIGKYITGGDFKDYKGTVIVDVLDDGSGYEIYGVDYGGNKYAYMRLVSGK